MDGNLNFNEKDKEQVVKFLNMLAKHAKFEMNTTEIIEYFKCLSYMQQQLLPKIESNYFEVKNVVESEEAEE